MKINILDLARRAGGSGFKPYADSPIEYAFTEAELNKFAELIIKETIQVARTVIECPSMNKAVYEHFGVEL